MRILPPGFRFHPTDVELIMYYLKKKVMGKKFQFEAIAELNIYKYAPWDLSDKSLLRRDLEWYFFSPIEKKYGSGARANRATVTGYWKATGKDRPVIYSNRTVGMIKTLIFYKGHAPKGERTNWVMHEYRIEDKNLADIGIIQDSYVLCKIFQKSGMGPKNGAQYGAPFNEDEWNEVESAEPQGDGPLLAVHLQPSSHNNSDAVSPAGATTSGSWPMSKEVQCPTRPLAINMPCPMADPSEDVVSWLPMCTDDAVIPIENNTTENANVLFESLHRTAPGPTFGSTLNEEKLNDVEETCAKSSPDLSLHVPYRNLNNSAALSLIVPGTSSSWPLSEPGPSAASTSVTKMPSYMDDLPEDDLPEDDITALLSMFTESSTMLPVEYNNNEHFNTVHTDKSVNAQTCMVKNAIYNGPGDLNNLGELRKSGFDFSNTCGADFTPNKILLDDDMVFLELKDLNTPLEHPAEASESVWAQTDSSYAPYTCYQNLAESYCGNLQNAVQNVSIFKQTSFPPEGPRWMEDDILEVSRKGPDIQNLEGYGSDTFMGNGIPFQMSHRQPQGNNIAGQIQRRGIRHRKNILQFSLESMYAELSVAELFAHIITDVKLNDSWSHYGGSSIYFKAEVALKVGECTEDALSHDMGESTCMRFCWGYLPENNIGENLAKCGLKFEIANWIASSMLGKLIFRRATYLIDTIVGSFLCVNCLENIIFIPSEILE